MRMNFIDAHHHLWNPVSNQPDIGYVWLRKKGIKKPFGDPSPIQRDYLIEEFSNESKYHQIIGSVHIQCDGALPDPILETAWIDQIAQENSFPIGSVGLVDLSKKNAEATLLRHLKHHSFRGVRQIIARLSSSSPLNFTDQHYLKNKTWHQHFGLLKEHQLSFDLQLYPEQMDQATDFLAQHPQVRIVIDHAGSLYSPDLKLFGIWEKGLELLSTLDQVSIKLSGFGMYQPQWDSSLVRDQFQTIYELFSSQKMMFGSNYPVDKLMKGYDQIINEITHLTDSLAQEEKENIFVETARKFYRLDKSIDSPDTPLEIKHR